MASKPNYKKKDNYYTIYLDKINFIIPFYYNGIKISDKMIKEIISKYENDSLDFNYKGEKLTEDEIKKLIKTQNNVLLNMEIKK